MSDQQTKTGEHTTTTNDDNNDNKQTILIDNSQHQ